MLNCCSNCLRGWLKALLFSLLTTIFIPTASMAYGEIIYVGADVSSETIEFSQKLNDRLQLEGLKPDKDIFVTFGVSGLKKAMGRGNFPIIATYITEDEFYLNTGEGVSTENISALFWEVSPLIQYQLAREIVGDGRIVVFSGKSDLQARIQLSGVTWLKYHGDPFALLDDLPEDTAAVLAIPDSSIYNRAYLRVILKHLYRKRIPLFGYTKMMVDSGALASLSTDTSTYLEQTVSLIAFLEKNGEFQRSWSSPTRIKFNRLLARSLQFELPESSSKEIQSLFVKPSVPEDDADE